MTSIFKITAAAFLTLGLASGAFAMEFTKGTVKKVDAKAKKVTLIHEELKRSWHAGNDHGVPCQG